MAAKQQTVVEDHSHSDHKGACPFSQPSGSPLHGFCPRQPTDIRSSCPALNALSNHGYLNRSGKEIYIWNITGALLSVYHLSIPLALFLSIGTLFLIRHWNPFRPLDLARLSVYGGVEHHASVVHPDVDLKAGLIYGPADPDPELIRQFEREVKENGVGEKPILVDYADMARARVRREREAGPIDSVHQDIARGEIALILAIWDRRKLGHKGNTDGAPLNWVLDFFGPEKLPTEWIQKLEDGTAQGTTLREIGQRKKAILSVMDELRGKKN